MAVPMFLAGASDRLADLALNCLAVAGGYLAGYVAGLGVRHLRHERGLIDPLPPRLGQVRAHRAGCAPPLVGERVRFFPRERLRRLVPRHRGVERLLVHVQLEVRLDHDVSRRLFSPLLPPSSPLP